MEININIDKKSLEEYFLTGEHRNASFTRSLRLLWNEVRLLRDKYPTFVLDSKLVAYEFAKSLGLKTPKIYEAGKSIEHITFRENSVLKPMSEDSSKGVMLLGEKELVRCLYSGRVFTGFDAGKQYARNLLSVNRVRTDNWLVEELIQGESIAQDIKFYCFYGKVGLVLESQRIPELKRCWYDDELNIVRTGRYEDSLFIGESQSYLKDMISLASDISKEIPSPFVRIDFLKQDNDIYLGEFTPIPGGYQNFNLEWDEKLGEMYQRAATRVALDVATGKKFDKYLKLEKDITKILKKYN